jgi:Zn-finger nucleic acid-binding protein
MEPIRKPVDHVFHRKTIQVVSSVTVCPKCGFEILADGQLDELVERTKVAYKLLC